MLHHFELLSCLYNEEGLFKRVTYIEAYRTGPHRAVFPSYDGTLLNMFRGYQGVMQEILKLVHLHGILQQNKYY